MIFLARRLTFWSSLSIRVCTKARTSCSRLSQDSTLRLVLPKRLCAHGLKRCYQLCG